MKYLRSETKAASNLNGEEVRSLELASQGYNQREIPLNSRLDPAAVNRDIMFLTTKGPG